MSNFEHCCDCGERTGRAGISEDSLYHGTSIGPFCESCFDEWPDKMVAQNARLQAQVNELGADAARYQYIRNNQYWHRRGQDGDDPGFSLVSAKFAYDDDFQAKPMLDWHIDKRLRAAENSNQTVN